MHIFTLVNIPVFVHPAFFLMVLYFYLFNRGLPLVELLVFVVALFISVLVHEFGHATFAKRFQLQPKIVISAFGGYCEHQPAASLKREALIIIAGPLAGLMLGGITYTIVQFINPITLLQQPLLASFLSAMLYINLVWSFINLLPFLPLDGGHLLRVGLRAKLPALKAERIARIVSIVTGVLAIGAAIYYQMTIAAFFAAFMIFQNIRQLNALTQAVSSAPKRSDAITSGLVHQAIGALKDNNPREALRLSYQAKDEPGLGSRDLDTIWTILTTASYATGEYEDAIAYSVRAPRSPDVFFAKVASLAKLKKFDKAKAALAESDAPSLPDALRTELHELIEKR